MCKELQASGRWSDSTFVVKTLHAKAISVQKQYNTRRYTYHMSVYHENSNPSQPYRMAISTLSLSSCSHEYVDRLRLLKHVEACGICHETAERNCYTEFKDNTNIA